MSDDLILIQEQPKWLEITLNRPDSFNALSEAMLDALISTLHEVATRDDLHCLVIKAKGKAFCAGHDLKEIAAHKDPDYYQGLFNKCSQMMQAVVNLPIPVIAQVQGLATAAGCQLVAACDLAIAANTARFAVSGINLGLFCATPAVALSRNMAPKQAMEMLLTGRFIDANEALAKGLLNQVVAPDALDTASHALATTIASKSQVAITAGKQLFYQQLDKPLPQAYALACATMVDNIMDADTQTSIDAFAHKKTS